MLEMDDGTADGLTRQVIDVGEGPVIPYYSLDHGGPTSIGHVWIMNSHCYTEKKLYLQQLVRKL